MAETVYEETLFAKRLTAILGVMTALLFGLIVFQVVVESESLQSTLGSLSVALFVLFAVLTVNFRRLHIRMTAADITIGYGIFTTTVPWERVTGCRVDNNSVVRYGGWGIRVTRIGGDWRLVYNTMGDPRVILGVADGRFGEISFSTAHPEEVIETVSKHAKATEQSDMSAFE